MESMYLRRQYITGTHFLCKEDSLVKNNSNSWNSSQTCTSLPHEVVCGGIISTIHTYIIPLTQETQTFPPEVTSDTLPSVSLNPLSFFLNFLLP